MFADLHTHTHFSDGTFSPEELAARAKAAGLSAIALTDHDTVEGCGRMTAACAKEELEFIPGAVSKRGRELGIATPFNDAIVEIDRMINRGELAMSADNFKLLQEKVGVKAQA